jgi:hypothetical protein
MIAESVTWKIIKAPVLLIFRWWYWYHLPHFDRERKPIRWLCDNFNQLFWENQYCTSILVLGALRNNYILWRRVRHFAFNYSDTQWWMFANREWHTINDDRKCRTKHHWTLSQCSFLGEGSYFVCSIFAGRIIQKDHFMKLSRNSHVFIHVSKLQIMVTSLTPIFKIRP